MAVLVESLLLVLAVAVVIRLLMAHLKFRQLELAIPGPPSLPLLGNALYGIGLTPDNLMATFMRLWDGRHAELWRLSAFGRLAVFVSNPDHLQELFTRKEFVSKGHLVYRFVRVLGRGSITLNGAEWKAHRRALQPAFHQSVLDRFTPVFTAEALGFVRRVRPGEAQDVEASLQHMAARNFIRTTIATEEGGEADIERLIPDVSAWVEAFTLSLAHRVVQPWLWLDVIFFNFSEHGRQIRRLSRKFSAFCRQIISARRVQLQRTSSEEEDVTEDARAGKYRTLVDILLEPSDRLSLSDEEILGEFKTFAGAAIDTSVVALNWAVKVLSLRQDVQQRIVQEVEEVLSKETATHITTNDLDRLVYMERVLKETLRLLPAVPFLARDVKKQTVFCGHTLPAGTTLIMNVLGVHRDPRHWPDPLRFDPDRFLPENSVGRHPYAYLPFSLGPRNCIGGRYAMMAMKTLLATLLPRYRIDPVDDGYKEPADLPMMMGLTTRMQGGARVVLTPRQSPDCAA